MRPLHGKLRKIKLRAVHADPAVIEQSQQNGVFEFEAQFLSGNVIVQMPWPLDLRGSVGTMKEMSGVDLRGRRCLRGGKRKQAKNPRNTFF